MLPNSPLTLEKSHSAPLLEKEKCPKGSAGALSPLSLPCSLPSSPSSSRTWSSYVPHLRRFNPLYLFSNTSKDQPSLEVNLSQVKILEEAETQKTADLFKKFYGDELVEKVLARYKINRPLSPILATALLYGIGAEIREKTLVQFYQKLKEQKIPLEDFLKLGLTEEIFAALCSVVETTPYEQMDDEQIDLLMSALQGPLLLSQITDEQSKGMVKELIDLDAAQAFQSDYQIFRRCTQQQEFHSENYPESAQAEFWSRKPPYAALKAGMLIAGCNLETDRPIYYKVINGIDKEGFGVFLLQGAAPQNHNKVMMLFRGTDPSNIDSLRGNLGRASGLDPFLKEEANIHGMFLSLCELIPGQIQLSVHGHSQGGALSQHFMHSLTRAMAAQAGKGTPLQKIKTIEMSTWEAPAILEEQAREFCESMLALSRHVDTMHVRASLNYHQVDKDLVVRCGEVFLGRFRKSYNFDCKVLTFPLKL
ncbi:MAG: hypothetical protein LLG04_11805 [Parachlamydia sp.]|nr:hypothetical protein [Parachlamydia sp.]